MKASLGIDMGISSTKVAGLIDNRIVYLKTIDGDSRHDIKWIVNLFEMKTGIDTTKDCHICATGVKTITSATELAKHNISVCDEFTACILGAKYNNPLGRFIIAGFGSGTPFIMVDGNESRHLGGFGIGGGTLGGLSKLLFGDISMETLADMACKGNPSKVNLLIGDVCGDAMPNLPVDTTASNFGKINSQASKEDIAAGLVRLVIETIGSAANLASQICGIKDIVAIGRLAEFPPNKKIFDALEALYNINFHVPEHCGYRTAIGAALCNR